MANISILCITQRNYQRIPSLLYGDVPSGAFWAAEKLDPDNDHADDDPCNRWCSARIYGSGIGMGAGYGVTIGGLIGTIGGPVGALAGAGIGGALGGAGGTVYASNQATRRCRHCPSNVQQFIVS